MDFENINLFTGKNSSGKTNMLLAICNALNSKTDFGQVFYENVVTLGKGIKHTSFKITVDKPGKMTMQKFSRENKSRLVSIETDKFIFENLVAKKTLMSTCQKLFFTGKYKTRESAKIADMPDIEAFMKSEDVNEMREALVYSAKENENQDNSFMGRLLETPTHEDSSDFLEIFNRSKERIWCSFTDDTQSFSSSLILKYVTQRVENPEEYELIIKRLKDHKPRFGDINKSKFVYLIADIQKNRKQHLKFKNDLKLYSEGIVEDVRVCTSGAQRGQVIIDAPNTPTGIQYLSAGTAVVVFFITLKNWLDLDFRDKSYLAPTIMFFDEIDSIVHASIIPIFADLLKSISKKVQLFISTHSPHFIDEFEKQNIYYLKDLSSIPDNAKERTQNIYSYQAILNRLPSKHRGLMNKPNSLLFVDGLIDAIFPLTQ